MQAIERVTFIKPVVYRLFVVYLFYWLWLGMKKKDLLQVNDESANKTLVTSLWRILRFLWYLHA